jgi:hypothetical protein
MTKTLKFSDNLTPLILSKQKTATWRLFDDKNLSVGDHLEFINKSTNQCFAHAIIDRILHKKFNELQPTDHEGHEKYANNQEMYATYSSYYGQPVDANTDVKIIHFHLQ